MTKPTRKQRDAERRITIERYHQLADASEQYELDKASALSAEERQRLMNDFSALRTAHRLEDVRRGTRPQETAVMMRRDLWGTWATTAGEHLLRARALYDRIAQGDTAALEPELRESFEAIGASAAMVEAVYMDLVYLVPQRPSFNDRYEEIVDLLEVALGLDASTVDRLKASLEPLFDARNGALHPYSELQILKPHPAGVDATGAEHATYNALTAEQAVSSALAVIDLAAVPPRPANRWVSRWVEEHRATFDGPVATMRKCVGL